MASSAIRARWRRKAGRLLWLARSLVLPASALAHSPKVLVSPELNSFGQRFAAICMLFRLRLWRAADCLRLLTVNEEA